MLKNLQDFHHYVGETIMFCQCIERDIKFIYAGMLKGDFSKNYASIEKWTLGKTVSNLQELDNSDDKPYLSVKDYELLKQITSVRNHCAHEAYTDFIYEHNFENSHNFRNQLNHLINDNKRLKKLSKIIENLRLEILKKYDRI